jgi:hypothetical protein
LGRFSFDRDNYYMLDQDQLQKRIKEIMVEIMIVLYEHGIKEAHMGAMMRLLGVDDENAAKHDDESVVLDEKFGEMITKLNKPVPLNIPSGTTFH